MSEAQTIHVADVSDGIGGDATAEAGSPVELPVVDVLTGRSFITGKSGSGKSNTASVIIENLLDDGFPVMIVDTDGEYYGLKEEYEILHAGADDECDIVVSPEHAEKIASLALEQNVPIILDVSGYLEESTANELLLKVVRQLFAKEKKLKKPFLLVVEECHEYIPEGGGMDETGRMLIKVGKRGRKHGLGIVGISQRPADVKKDFITQCDWLCWHRLTWDNDTKVVGRILGSKYADAVEELDNGEAFLMTDWDESIRRIQFHRKQTFDAGATPGLDDFERPELKSVSGDLVSELQTISDERARRESELADLRQELDTKRAQINQLERELEEARDLKNMADKFAQAMLGRAEAPYRGGQGRNLRDPAASGGGGDGQAGLDEYGEPEGVAGGDTGADESGKKADPGAGVRSDTTAAESIPEAAETDPADVDPTPRSVTPEDVAAGALELDAKANFGTREAVIEELRSRVATLEPLSVEMLRHYRRERTSEPVAAHIDAGGDADREHAYARHRPIRTQGLVRHVGQGRYAYAIPDLIREAYADRLQEDAVAEMVREVEAAFVPSVDGERGRDGEGDDERGRDGEGDGDHEAGDATSTNENDGSDPEPESDSGSEPRQSPPGLSEDAKRFAKRATGGDGSEFGT